MEEGDAVLIRVGSMTIASLARASRREVPAGRVIGHFLLLAVDPKSAQGSLGAVHSNISALPLALTSSLVSVSR